MALGTFTVGRDCQAVFISPNGTRLDLSGMTGFKWTPEYKTARAEPLNAPAIERNLPYGHRISFDIDRNGPANDALISQIEQGWWVSGSADPGTSSNGTIFVYVTEADGSQTTLQFSGVSIKMDNGGDFRADAPVKQSFSGYAQRMAKV